MTIRVLLADDQPLVRTGLRMVIDAAPGVEVVGEAATGSQAVSLTRRLAPDVVVMDIRMPGMDGIEATRMITQESPHVRVAVLTTFDTDQHVHAALRAGASGFLVKDMDLDGFLTALRVVAMRRRADRPRRHPPSDRPLRRSYRTRARADQAGTRRYHRTRTGGPHPRRTWPVQPRARRRPQHQPRYCQGTCRKPAHQTRRPRPGPPRHRRV